MKRAVGLGSFAGLALVIFEGSAWGYGGYGYGPGMMYGPGWGGGLYGWLMMFLFIVLIVVIVTGILHWLFKGGYHAAPTSLTSRNRAMDILEERFARGEIDREEFEEKRALIADSVGKK